MLLALFTGGTSYCSKEIELRAKLQSDDDIITLDYGKDKELLHALRDKLT